MVNKNIFKCWFTILLAILVSTSCLISEVFAAPAEQNVAPPGSDQYVAISQYMEPTDIPNVSKVTLIIDPPKIEKPEPAIFVAVALDPSTSMTRIDIWDSKGEYDSDGIPKWIDRYEAVELAVSKLIDELVSSGNKNIYINLRGHTRNSVTSSDPKLKGFESLYDSSGNLKSKFIFGSSNWIMNSWGGTMRGFSPSPLHNTNWGNSSDNNVGEAFERIHDDFKQSIVSKGIKDIDSRYILVLGDGADDNALKTGNTQYQYNTQRIALALKAPIDSAYLAGNSVASKQILGLPTNTFGGIGATIWSVSVGPDINRNYAWRNEYFALNASTLWNQAGAAPFTGVSSSLIFGNFGSLAMAEYYLIADSLVIPEGTIISSAAVGSGTTSDYINYLNGLVGSFTTSNVHYFQSLRTRNTDPSIADLAVVPTASYVTTNTPYNGWGSSNWQDNTDPLLNTFEDFGKAAIEAAGGGEDIQVNLELTKKTSINGGFELYHYPGIKDLITMYTDDPATDLNMRVTSKNGNIDWQQAKMNGGYRYQIVFYVKYDGPEDQNIPLFSSAYIQYMNENMKHVIKNFPITYYEAQKIVEQKDPNTVHMNPVANSNQSITISSEEVGVPITDISNSIAFNNDYSKNSIGSINITLQPYKASVPNTAATKKKKATTTQIIENATETIDEAATKKEKGKTIVMNVSKVPVYEEANKKAKIVLYLMKGKQFKIAGVTENYYMIQYKKKDGKVYKGYILKKDVKIVLKK